MASDAEQCEGQSSAAQQVENWHGSFQEISLPFHLRRTILFLMTKLLDQAVAAARCLPSEIQDDIARIVLQLAGADDAPPVALSADEQAAISASKEAAARGEFATDAQVRAIWAKHGP